MGWGAKRRSTSRMGSLLISLTTRRQFILVGLFVDPGENVRDKKYKPMNEEDQYE